jgi:hypothetical protein
MVVTLGTATISSVTDETSKFGGATPVNIIQQGRVELQNGNAK